MGRRTQWIVGLALLQVALLVATYFWKPLGTAAWHHAGSLALVLAGCIPLRRHLTSRRFLAMGILTFTILATLSGFYLLYWKEGIRIDGYQDWGVFWHVLWSWAAMVFFFQHTWVNRVALGHFFRRSFQAVAPAVAHAGGYVLLLVAFALTWSAQGRILFTGANYIQLSFWAWILATVPLYAAWLIVRTSPALHKRVGHWSVRRANDLVLVPAAALVVVSGIALIFLDGPLEDGGWKYVSKYWHVWPSVLFAVIVFVHAVQAWRSVQAHWRAIGRQTRPRAHESKY